MIILGILEINLIINNFNKFEKEDKEKIITCIVDFLKEKSHVNNDFYKIVLIKAEASSIDPNIIEINNPGNTDVILKEIKEIQNYKYYLNLDIKIGKELQDIEAGIQRMFFKVFVTILIQDAKAAIGFERIIIILAYAKLLKFNSKLL